MAAIQPCTKGSAAMLRSWATASCSTGTPRVQALIGTRAVGWLFRLVGIAWFVAAGRALLARL